MSILGELRRRNVIRVGIAYIAASWLIIQVVETLFPVFGLGNGALRVAVILLAVGFIPVVIGAWAFELTPEGIRRDSEVAHDLPVSRTAGRRLDRIIMIVLALAVGYFVFDEIVVESPPDLDKSIAVLPFADMSPDGDQAYFADGVAEEVLNVLAGIKNLRVISRSSSFALRNDDLSIPELAEKLGVAYILEGSVRKGPDNVRITAQLIEGHSDRHLWSKTYDRTLDDVFAVQDEISTQVVRELKIRLLGPQPVSGSTNIDAYQLYLEGLSVAASQSQDDMSAVDLFEQVTAMDPDYAPAHGSLALALLLTDQDDPVWATRAEESARTALALDPENPDALTTLGWIQLGRDRAAEAREFLERAIASNPSYSLAYRWLGITYANADPARYLALVQKAYLVDPLHPSIHFNLSNALSRMGRTDEALAVVAGRQALTPTHSSPFAWAGMYHRRAGRLALALKSHYRAFRMSPGHTAANRPIPLVLMDLNEPELALVWAQAIDRDEAPGGSLIQAGIMAFNGNSDSAIQAIETAVEQGSMTHLDLAWALTRFADDPALARKAYEQGLRDIGQDVPHVDADLWWPWFIDYALLLQRTGEPDRASGMISDLLALIEPQLESGAVIAQQSLHLDVYLAQLHALGGEHELALSTLTRATRDGMTCEFCLRTVPHFDSMRDDPAFVALLADINAGNAAQRQRLADEGMLLTPEEVLALERFDFDPFVSQ